MKTRFGFLRKTMALSGILATVFMVPVTAQEVLKADTIVTNGRIITMDNKELLSSDPGTIVEAMAVREGRILALGTSQQIQEYAKPGTRYIDVKGKTVIPGIVETHVHPESTVNNIDHLASERDPYDWAPGLHTAVLIEAGVNVVGETEYSRMHPGIYFNALDLFAHRRVRNAGAPLDSAVIVMPEEAVSRATALRLYTSKAAEWLFAEDLVGTLEVGKMADFAVIDRDLFSVPTAEFLDNKVILTVVGDKIVYQDPDWQPAVSTASR